MVKGAPTSPQSSAPKPPAPALQARDRHRGKAWAPTEARNRNRPAAGARVKEFLTPMVRRLGGWTGPAIPSAI